MSGAFHSQLLSKYLACTGHANPDTFNGYHIGVSIFHGPEFNPRPKRCVGWSLALPTYKGFVPSNVLKIFPFGNKSDFNDCLRLVNTLLCTIKSPVILSGTCTMA